MSLRGGSPGENGRGSRPVNALAEVQSCFLSSNRRPSIQDAYISVKRKNRYLRILLATRGGLLLRPRVLEQRADVDLMGKARAHQGCLSLCGFHIDIGAI